MTNISKNPLKTVWHAVVGSLALQHSDAAAAASAHDSLDAVRTTGYRRLQQGTPAAPAAPATSGARISVAPAQGGMPPMLAINGQATSWIGFNLSPPGAPTCGIPLDLFDSTLDYMHDKGANVMRTWAFQAQNPAGNWAAFDHAVQATQARGMVLTAVLGNQWGDCEPTSNNLKQFKTLAWYQSGYKQVQPGDTLSYRDYVQAVATRYSAYGHLHFQLMNEALAADLIAPGVDDASWTCPDEGAAALALQAFTRDLTGLIRQAAPHALVALGTRGQPQECGTSTDANYQAIGSLVDVCEIHSYDESPTVVANRLGLCQAVGKPTLMGESAASAADALAAANAGAIPNPTGGDVVSLRQAELLYYRLANYTSGGLGGMVYWHFITPIETGDVYTLQLGHPIFGKVQNTDKQALAASARAYQTFATMAQSLWQAPDR